MPTPRKTGKRKTSIHPLPRVELKLIGLGLFLWLIFGIYRLYELKILSFQGQIAPASAEATAGNAVIIDIPKVNLHLPIVEANIIDGTWEISPDGASHWDNSANPGDSGNIVIYGHNKTNLFGPIRWLNPGDEIILTNTENQEYRYQITETVSVKPNQTGYIQPKDKETLTLYTCTGLFDRERYLVVAKPI